MSDRVEAFVPGHVTGFFTVDRDDDPTKTGSRGAGLTLSEGVTVRVSPANERTVELNGTAVEMAAAERVLRTLDADAVVHAETDLPVGAGLGVSGGVTLGTALAVNAVFDRGLSENELATIAHGAEVEAGTGLGDVVAQLRGGVPIRLEPGGPQHGVLDGIPTQTRVEFVSFGELPTPEVFGGPEDGDDPGAFVTRKGQQALSTVVKEPTLPTLVYASRRFARETGLLTERSRDTITAVSEAGGEASMAMLGDTVFALGTGLSDAGYEPRVTNTSTAGATLL